MVIERCLCHIFPSIRADNVIADCERQTTSTPASRIHRHAIEESQVLTIGFLQLFIVMAWTFPPGGTDCITINGPCQHPCPQYIHCHHPTSPDLAFYPSDRLVFLLPPPSTIPPAHELAPVRQPVHHAPHAHHAPAAVHPTSASDCPAPPPFFSSRSFTCNPVVLVNKTQIDLFGDWCVLQLFLLVCAASLVGWQVLKWRATDSPSAPIGRPDTAVPWCKGLPEEGNDSTGRSSRPGSDKARDDCSAASRAESASEYSSDPDSDPTSNRSTGQPALRRRSRTSSLRSQFVHGQTLEDLHDQDQRMLSHVIAHLRDLRRRHHRLAHRFTPDTTDEAQVVVPLESHAESERGLEAYEDFATGPVDGLGGGHIESQEVEDVNGYLTGDEREDQPRPAGRHRQSNRPDHENVSVYRFLEVPFVLPHSVKSFYPDDLDDEVDGYAPRDNRTGQAMRRKLPASLSHHSLGQQLAPDVKCNTCCSPQSDISPRDIQPSTSPNIHVVSAECRAPETTYTCICMHDAPQDPRLVGASISQHQQTSSSADGETQTRPRQRLARSTLHDCDFRDSDGERRPDPRSHARLRPTVAGSRPSGEPLVTTDPPLSHPSRGAVSAESIAPEPNISTHYTSECFFDIPAPYYREAGRVPQQPTRHRSVRPPQCTTCHEVGRPLCLFCGPTEERHLTEHLDSPDDTFHIGSRHLTRRELLDEIERLRRAVLFCRVGERRLRGGGGAASVDGGCAKYITRREMQRSLRGMPESRHAGVVVDGSGGRVCGCSAAGRGLLRGSGSEEDGEEEEQLQGDWSTAAYGDVDTSESNGDVQRSGSRGGGLSQSPDQASSNVGSDGRLSSGIRQTDDGMKAAPRLHSFPKAQRLDRQQDEETNAASLASKLCKQQHTSAGSYGSESRRQNCRHLDSDHNHQSQNIRHGQDRTTTTTGPAGARSHRSRSSPAQAHSTTERLVSDLSRDPKNPTRTTHTAGQNYTLAAVLERIPQSGLRAEPPASPPTLKPSRRGRDELGKSTTVRSTLYDDSSNVAVYESPVSGATNTRREKYPCDLCGSLETLLSVRVREETWDESAPHAARSGPRDPDECWHVVVRQSSIADTTDRGHARHSNVVRLGKLRDAVTESSAGKSGSHDVHVPHVIDNHAPDPSSYDRSEYWARPRARSRSLTPEDWKREAGRLRSLADVAASTQVESRPGGHRHSAQSLLVLLGAVSDDQFCVRSFRATAAQRRGRSQSGLFPVPLPAVNKASISSPRRSSVSVARSRGNHRDISRFLRHQGLQCSGRHDVHQRTEYLVNTADYGGRGVSVPATQRGIETGSKAAAKDSNRTFSEQRPYLLASHDPWRTEELTIAGAERKGKNKQSHTPSSPVKPSEPTRDEKETPRQNRADRSPSSSRYCESIEGHRATQYRTSWSLRGGAGDDGYQNRRSHTSYQQPSVHDTGEEGDDGDEWETTSEVSSVGRAATKVGDAVGTARAETGNGLSGGKATGYIMEDGDRTSIEEATIGRPPARQINHGARTDHSTAQDDDGDPSQGSPGSTEGITQQPPNVTARLIRQRASDSTTQVNINPTPNALVSDVRSLRIREDAIPDLRPNTPVSNALHHQEDLFSPPRMLGGQSSLTSPPPNTIFEDSSLDPRPSSIPGYDSEQEPEEHAHIPHQSHPQQDESSTGDNDFEPYQRLTRGGSRPGPVQRPTRGELHPAPSRAQSSLETETEAEAEAGSGEHGASIHSYEYPDLNPRRFPLDRLPSRSLQRGGVSDCDATDPVLPAGPRLPHRDDKELEGRPCTGSRNHHLAGLGEPGVDRDGEDQKGSGDGNGPDFGTGSGIGITWSSEDGNLDLDLDSFERDGPLVALTDAYAHACGGHECEKQAEAETEVEIRGARNLDWK